MSIIITVTLNPTIDKTFFVPSLLENQKLQCPEVVEQPGGGGIVVSRAIKKLGGYSKALFLSGGHLGAFFVELFKKKKIEYESFKIQNETRQSLIIRDDLNSKHYILDAPGPIIFDTEWQDLLTYISKQKNVSYLVASGNLPPGVPIDFYAQMAKIAKQINAKFILDTDGEPLQLAINEGLYLIKPNLKEMGILTGIVTIDIETAKAIGIGIINSKKCEAVVISLGSEGALLITENFTEYFVTPKIEAKNTSGAGDCMLAGIVLKLSENAHLKEAVRYGVSCGAATCMKTGTDLFIKKNVDILFENHSNSGLTYFKNQKN
ncbi:MAG: 1-phosphofructokinase family hexose kinase [Flavobacterium sp.]|nr:1-phosphofructokinase family hexose kinase [Flavobacterium sp.]